MDRDTDKPKPEDMGFSNRLQENENQPKESESADSKVEVSEETIAEWQNSERPDFAKLKVGTELGIPHELLEGFWQEPLNTKKDDKIFEYHWRRNTQKLGLGSEEETCKAGVHGYKQAMAQNNYLAAIEIAKEIFGEESLEYNEAFILKDELETQQGMASEKVKNLEEERNRLPRDLTIAEIQNNVLFVLLLKELGSDITQAYAEMTSEEKDATTVLDFFKQFGIDEETIEATSAFKFKK